ncbi:hypothetical protein L226DRAFT_537456 [Lentinus tigrinus ALCF2SS1-7]|uniref:F-box domain-containing protein n=1 Tax=Lentinus tigrinus ALCF2SS1-6 TaxID=1328759 RepID=A0A5C2S3E8_9APHY|nr:hypothetical protein L227DRAFT_655512 [Lentinus tigrinus ALCF2SS1-6]RPD72023.1 hypothetical protein L226DRAFT_537456 [Lentinus tigrinus ALCF2SS1-7]
MSALCPVSMAHQVLFTQELLEAIFSQLSTGMQHPDDTPEDVQERAELRRTLARAARVCQTFREAALNVLWCALDNIVPLLRLLPEFQERESEWMLTDAITEEGWTRLLLHARRIRGLCHYRGTAIDPGVWAMLLTRSEGHLMPRLRVLDISEIPIPDFPFVLLTLCPSLSELYLSFQDDSGPNGRALPSIAAILIPSIVQIASDLTILYLDEHFPVPSESIASLERLSRLKELKLCDPETTVCAVGLRAISRLESLRVLSIEDLRLYGANVELADGLKSLETLYVHGSPGDIRILVQGSRFVALKHFDIMVHCEDGILPAESLASTVSSLPQTVHKLRLGFCDGDNTNPPSCSVADILQLVQPLKELTHISLDNGMRRITMSDADIKVLFDQWPRLHHFTLDEDKDRPRDLSVSQPTYATLLDIATRCPDLESFAATYFDATSLPATVDVPAVPRHLRSLVFEYFLGDTPPESIARIIHLLFPSLDIEHDAALAAAASPRPGTRLWSLVLDALKTLRAQERGASGV